MLDEWDWFDSMKKTYGLNIKYIKSRFDKAPAQCVTYMNSGKALDIIPTHRAGFPKYFMLGRALDPYVNMQYVNNSPGVDNRTLEQTKWDDTYRCISPIGAVDVIWYNESMVSALGLQDPYTLWKQDKWDWAAFETFQKSVPLKTLDGKSLTGFAQSMPDTINFFPRTNGVSTFDLKTTGGKTQLTHNFNDQRSLDAMTWIAGVCKSNGWIDRRSSEDPQMDMYVDGTCIMASTLHLMGEWSNKDYAKTQEYNWVPYPKGPGEGGENICMNYGATMMLPKKTKSEKNVPYAVKFMELWANRFTEAIFDYLDQKCYNFSYAERKEYFNFATQHNYFPNGTSTFDGLTGSDKEYFNQFRWSFYNPNYNVATTLEQVCNIVNKAVEGSMEFAT
jgi:ABC-type glycerol-3-phosphate transport system substrate-binding protein